MEVVTTEAQVLLLLNALPRSYDNVRDALLFGGRTTISVNDVVQGFKQSKCYICGRMGLKLKDHQTDSMSVGITKEISLQRKKQQVTQTKERPESVITARSLAI